MANRMAYTIMEACKLVLEIAKDDDTLGDGSRAILENDIASAKKFDIEGIEGLIVYLQSYYECLGPCDHSVGVCLCGLKDTYESLYDVIDDLEERGMLKFDSVSAC